MTTATRRTATPAPAGAITPKRVADAAREGQLHTLLDAPRLTAAGIAGAGPREERNKILGTSPPFYELGEDHLAELKKVYEAERPYSEPVGFLVAELGQRLLRGHAVAAREQDAHEAREAMKAAGAKAAAERRAAIVDRIARECAEYEDELRERGWVRAEVTADA